jgi:hypothetical protein
MACKNFNMILEVSLGEKYYINMGHISMVSELWVFQV